MTKFKLLFILLLLFAITSCWWQEATREEEETAFKNAVYDNQIIQDIDKYTVLKNFLLDNLDTIINYRNANNKVTFIGANSDVDSIRQVDEPCWLFTVPRGPYDITKVPNFLRAHLDTLIKNLGENRLANFTICNDRTMIFNIRFVNKYSVNDLNVLHQLSWNKITKEEEGYDFVKHTSLKHKWTYNICVFKEQGW